MKHIAETVILQKGTEKQKLNKKNHAFLGWWDLSEISNQSAVQNPND